MKKQSLIKGTLILGVAGIIAKFLGLFFRWPLIMLIGDEGVGYYQISYPLYMFFIAVASGIPIAMSKMISERNAVSDRDGIILILRKGLLLIFIFGGSFTFFMITFSRQLISLLKWDQKSYYSLIAIALAPIFISIMSAFRGFFQGLQYMTPTAVSQIIEQLGRVIVGIGLVVLLLPRGIEFAAGGAAFGAVAGGIFAAIYLILKYLKIRKEFSFKKTKDSKNVLGKLLYIAIPISMGAAVGTIMSLIDSVIVPQRLLEAGFTSKDTLILYGQLTGKAFILINVPLTLSMALCASLVPIIAEAFILHRRLEVISKVEMAIKFSAVIALPSLCGLYFMSYPILNLLFPGHADGYTILKYLALCIPFIVLAQTTTAILQGIGKYLTPVRNILFGCILKITITLVLVKIPQVNIYGAVIGTITGYIVASILNLISLKKYLNFSLNYYDTMIKPAYASILMIISVVFIYMNVYNYTKINSISLLISIASGVIIYILFIVIFGVFDYKFIKSKLIKSTKK